MTTATERPQLICLKCSKTPEQLEEYFPESTGSPLSASDYVWQQEGTLNRRNGHFLCTKCYIEAGQPSSPHGWVAP